MTVYRAVTADAPAAAENGRWWADDADSCRAVVTELYRGHWDDHRVVERDIDVAGFTEFDAGGEDYDPDMEAEWEAAIAAGAPGVIVHDCVMTEGFYPVTVVLLTA